MTADDLNDGWTYEDRINSADNGSRADEFYASKYPHSPLAVWRQRFAVGLIRLDGELAAADAPLRSGQLLTYQRPPWREPQVPDDIEVVFEDDDLIAVAKPAGLPVLPGGNYLRNTLLAVIEARYGSGVDPVHRLGRGTSGLVLFARTDRARKTLSAALRDRHLGKTYRALVRGTSLPDRISINQPIGPVAYPHLPHIHAAAEGGAQSLSECQVVYRDPVADRSIVEVRLISGRPHQIRIHMAAVGHPLVGDPLYGAGGVPTQSAIDNQVLPGDCGYHLHATRLDLVHPASRRRMSICCPPPPELTVPGMGQEAPEGAVYQ